MRRSKHCPVPCQQPKMESPGNVNCQGLNQCVRIAHVLSKAIMPHLDLFFNKQIL